jgi:Xaa-Pro aminopeptidase
MSTDEKINELRKYMKTYGIAAYIVPTDDFHGSEYVGAYFKAREYMSGFTGSAGTLVVLQEQACLWTDGRYFLQAEEQLRSSEIILMRIGEEEVPTIPKFLGDKLQQGDVVGFDGRTVSNDFVKRIAEETGEKKITFQGDEDLVERIWKERPAMSKEPVWELEVQYAGLSREEKLLRVREKMEEEKADVLLLTALDEIAWLLNLRGNDVLYTPVFLAFMLIYREKATLYVHEEIISNEIRTKLQKAGVELADYDSIEQDLEKLQNKLTVWLDEAGVNYRLSSSVPKEIEKLNKPSPVVLMKAVKTQEEMEHIRLAHVKDGVAVTRFMYWLKSRVGKEKITEISAAEKLEELREEMEHYIEPSFSPIIAYGPHGAIVHYEATEESDVELKPEGLCLADTGGHYLEGTTDITRTFALGETTEEEKRCFTTVLRGHLNLAGAKFLYGLCGQNLDYLARAPLWEQNMDFNHGTGHGVGYLLNVHEGPQSFRCRYSENQLPTTLEEGMVISDEPGLYLTGKFGIRHENLVMCRKGEKNEYGQFMYFETLTMVPFDRDAIDASLMREDEIAQLNAYHQKVYETLSPYFEEDELQWLFETTRPL